MDHAADSSVSIARIRMLAASFYSRPSGDSQGPGSLFLPREEAGEIKRLGHTFWLPESRAYAVFLYAYTALFGIPCLAQEALDRQPDRFSPRRLHRTIRSTSSFILDAFGYDRRTGRDRDAIYSPAPAIKGNHGRTASGPPISDAAMVYFGLHLVRASEWLAASSGAAPPEADREAHYRYFAEFYWGASRSFPSVRAEADAFTRNVDQSLAGDGNTDLWQAIPVAAHELDIPFDSSDLIRFLLPVTSRHYAARATEEPNPFQEGDTP